MAHADLSDGAKSIDPRGRHVLPQGLPEAGFQPLAADLGTSKESGSRNPSPFFIAISAARLPGFDLEFITTGTTSYLHCDDRMQSTMAGGVLPGGVCVWLMPQLLRKEQTKLIVGFVEQIGLINLNPRSLRRADAPPLRPASQAVAEPPGNKDTAIR